MLGSPVAVTSRLNLERKGMTDTTATKDIYRCQLPPLGFFGIDLKKGAHDDRMRGVCAMEAAAWLAGEPHSDSPQCACPVVAAFVRSWNDALQTDEERNRLLKPLIPRLVGSRSTKAVEERRGWLAIDWLIRTFAPEWLSLVHDLSPHAEALRNLPEIVNGESVTLAEPLVSAAGSAARSAALSAARSDLEPTMKKLQASAVDLLERMLAVTPESLAA